MPAIPESIFTVGGFEVTKGIMLMLLFAGLMVFASISMIRQDKKLNGPADENIDHDILNQYGKPVTAPAPKFNYGGILAEGAVVGTLTGLVGAGAASSLSRRWCSSVNWT